MAMHPATMATTSWNFFWSLVAPAIPNTKPMAPKAIPKYKKICPVPQIKESAATIIRIPKTETTPKSMTEQAKPIAPTIVIS